MSEGIIEGLVGGATQITVVNTGIGVTLAMRRRETVVEETLSVDQSRRLRKLLSGAERRAIDEAERGRPVPITRSGPAPLNGSANYGEVPEHG